MVNRKKGAEKNRKSDLKELHEKNNREWVWVSEWLGEKRMKKGGGFNQKWLGMNPTKLNVVDGFCSLSQNATGNEIAGKGERGDSKMQRELYKIQEIGSWIVSPHIYLSPLLLCAEQTSKFDKIGSCWWWWGEEMKEKGIPQPEREQVLGENRVQKSTF